MFKSFINPNKIIGNGTKAVNPKAFLNFLTGVKSTTSNNEEVSAVNRTSNIQQNTQIRPAKLNLQSLLSTISENITNIYNSNINPLRYGDQVKNKEDGRSSNILKGFLNLLRNSIDFINFFGNTRSSKRIENSVKALRNMFNDSFNTATSIRQTINKIVKQLSNLPTIPVPSGEANLDSKVANGTLTQAKTPSKGNLIKAGVAGLGVTGIGAAGMQAARLTQEEKLTETAKRGVGSEGSPDGFMGGLNKIIEKFSESINNLLGKDKKSTPSLSGGSSSTSNSSDFNNTESSSLTSTSSVTPGQFNKTGNLIASDVEASYYDPSKGGINASGIKTPSGEPATSTGEAYKKEVFSAAAFPSLLSKLPKTSTTSSTMKGGRTLARGQAFNVLVVDPKTNKSAVVRINDVGPGVESQSQNRMLDLSVAAKNYFGQNAKGLKIYTIDQNSTPGPVSSDSPILSNIKPKPSTASTIKPAPKKTKALEVSKNIATPPSQVRSDNMKVEVASLSPTVNVMPSEGSQDMGERVTSPPPITGQSSAPDVSMFGGVTKNIFNPGNVYALSFTPFGGSGIG